MELINEVIIKVVLVKLLAKNLKIKSKNKNIKIVIAAKRNIKGLLCISTFGKIKRNRKNKDIAYKRYKRCLVTLIVV